RSEFESLGFRLVENPSLLQRHLLAAGPYAALRALAALEDVAYIVPASADLRMGVPVHGCAGPIAEAGPLGEYVEVGRGWTRDASSAVALKYYFESLTEKVDESTVRAEIGRALREWTRYT